MVADWKSFLSEDVSVKEANRFRHHERTGRPLGDDGFVYKIEKVLNRPLKKQKPGPKPNKKLN